MRTKLFLTGALVLSLCAASTAQTLPSYLPGYSVFDADGNDYETIIIGDQQWTKRNLLTSHFSNGDSIANVIDGTEWYLLTNNPTPAWCSLSLDAQYDSSRGKLYNWYAVHDPRNICPIGWRTPGEADWDSLILYLDPLAVLDTIGYQSFVAGAGLKDTLNYLWNWGNFGATNATGFSARPAGIRGYYGNFYNGGNGIFLWTNSESSEFHAYFRSFEDFTTNVSRGTTQGIDNKTTGGSVRCVKGAPKIKGFLFNDLNNNCVRDNGEAGIGNTVVTINGASANVQTNSDGYWFLDSLAIGSYSLGINNNSSIDISCNAAFNIFGNESGIFQFAASVADSNSNSDSCNPLPSNLQNGLVGYWPFCGNGNDESGNGSDGTVNGATLTEDRFGISGSAFSFDGIDDFISVENSASLDVTGSNISISMWLNSTNDPNEDTFKGISKGGYWVGSGYELMFRNSLNGDLGTMQFTGGPGIQAYGTTDLDINSYSSSWYHVVACLNNGIGEIYINGQMQDIIQDGGFTNLVSNSSPLLIGTRTPGNNLVGFLKGKIDDIGIWNRALTPDEVQQLYTLNACTFTIYDTTNVTIYDTVSVSVSTTDTLIINTLITAVEPAQENTFLVYPNPASTQITINNGNVAILGGYTMRITNSLGQDVYNQNITQPEVTLDLSTWSGNGLYVLYIVDPQQNIVAVKQIVLQ